MKALVYHGPRILTVEERDEPKPGPGEALLRVGAAGICGSEVEGYLGQSSLRVPPLIMGHEFSGEVVNLGPADSAALRVGQQVTVNPLVSCGVCAFCQAGLAHICSHRTLIGAHRPGAFAEYVVVPLSAVIPLPESFDPMLGALAEPFAVAIHAAGLAHIDTNSAVVVWGAGSIGLLIICAARLTQPPCIIAVDRNPARLEAARVVGATHVLDAGEHDIISSMRKLVEDAPHVVVFDAVGSASTRQAALAVAGPGGHVILIGLHDKETTFDINAVIRSEVALQGSYAYSMADMRRAVALLATGDVPTAPWTEVRPLSDGPDAFAELTDRPGTVTKILLAP